MGRGDGEEQLTTDFSAVPPLSELEEYRWDRECYEVAYSIAQRWPQLKEDAGFYVYPDGRTGAHGWNVAADGTIVDMTATQHDYDGPQDEPEDEHQVFPAPHHPEIVRPSDPHYENYVSYSTNSDRAQTIAHTRGEHQGSDANPDVCPMCE